MIYQDLPYSIPEHLRTTEEIGLLETVVLEVSTAHDIPSALTAVLQRVCEKASWPVGQAWLPNRKHTALERRALWTCDVNDGMAEFIALCGSSMFLPGEGLPGRVWLSKQPAWLADTSSETHFPRSVSANRAGLTAAIGIPTLARKEVVGVLEFFLWERRDHDERLIKMITAVAMQLGLLIQHKQAEDALWTCQERYRVLAENAPVCIHEIDRQGRLIAVNRAGVQMLKAAKKSPACGIPALRLVPPADRPRIQQLLERAFAGEFPEFEFQMPGPESRTFLSCFMPLKDQEGTIGKLIGISQDITEHKRAEARLRQSQKMEAVGRLAGGVAHDFNNLLSIIMGYSELLLADTETSDPNRDRLQQIQEAANHGAWLTQQLLTFSRQQILRPAVIDLNAVVSQTSKMLRRLIGVNIELETVLEHELGAVRVDRGQVEQMIMNLAANSRDAMPHGGKLSIHTANVDVDSTNSSLHSGITPGRYVTLTFNDTGIGMSEETQAYIFEPFFTTKESGKGTGLGLAMVDGMVNQSGGNIRVSSVLGRGTTFQIYLPRLDTTVSGHPSDHTHTTLPAGSETVLLVEDAAPLRRLTREILESCGYTVLESGDSQEALRMFAHSRDSIALLMTDIEMPGMGGRELAQRLLETKSDLKVLFVSGCTEDVIRRLGIPNGEFLQKPYACASLAHKLREILERPGTVAD